MFRNETLDATHLAEFHQIEGVVADYNLTLGDLMGLLHSFFSKMGGLEQDSQCITSCLMYLGRYLHVCVHIVLACFLVRLIFSLEAENKKNK